MAASVAVGQLGCSLWGWQVAHPFAVWLWCVHQWGWSWFAERSQDGGVIAVGQLGSDLWGW
jgi:hypothetical protein